MKVVKTYRGISRSMRMTFDDFCYVLKKDQCASGPNLTSARKVGRGLGARKRRRRESRNLQTFYRGGPPKAQTLTFAEWVAIVSGRVRFSV